VRRAALGILALVAACSRQGPAAGDPDAGPSASPPGELTAKPGPVPSRAQPASSEMASATLRLLDPGSAPRRRLRYAWQAGRRELVRVDLRTATSTEVPGDKPTEIPLPPLHIDIAIDPQGASAEGSLLYAWHVASATVGENRDAPPEVAEGMRVELMAIQRLAGHAEVTARGLASDIAIDPGSVTDSGATGQMVEQVKQILRDLAAPFPEEEVGQGARWEKLSGLASKDARITQTDTFTLLDLKGDHGTVDDVLAQTAPAQALTPAGAGPGSQARLESMLASGDAKTRFDLRRLAPETAFAGTTSMVVSSQPSAERSRHLTMIMRIEIALSGSLR